MKKLFLLCLLSFPVLTTAQAHLGSTEIEIKNSHPDNTFENGYSDDGEKYISSFMRFGTFVYYFDKVTNLSSTCIQLIEDIGALNAQVEFYNNRYVIISDTQWKAYLEGGGILNIELSYNDNLEAYIFSYMD